MQSGLVFLCLSFFACVCTSAHEDADAKACPETLPVVENGEVSPMYLKSNYTEGDRLLYICPQGYVSLGKIIFVCQKNQWVNNRDNAKCSRKRCELPADIPNGRYVIVNGTDFVYGATIKYICKEGYQMVSRVNNRTCLAGGWDNHLPECAELSCPLPETESNVIMDGLLDYDTTLRYGHRIQFTCNSPGLKLVGPKESTCQENGEWSGHLPRCEEVTCELEELSSGVSVVGLPEEYAPMKYGHKLQFYCSHRETALRGRDEVTCSAGGTWSSPFPTCEVLTCKEGQLDNVRIVRGDPGRAPPYKPKHTLHFQCSYSDMIMMGPSSITCRSDGTWNSPYPTCIDSACGPPPNYRFSRLTSTPQARYEHGETVQYTCPRYYIIEGSPYATCNQGTWTGGHLRCLEPCIVTEDDMDDRKIKPRSYRKETLTIYSGYYLEFECQYRRRAKTNRNSFMPQCNNGVMYLPLCQ
ncbi:complement factor H-like [Pygocentrus nattereri]|uniref:Sushi domain-containing protein n=1 Tax=Pygocentrus nattereri TaxID=42514 RepID=A0A3B4C902_PYGNA|nr:complement factor H-like [Pygocentrus nattereri]